MLQYNNIPNIRKIHKNALLFMWEVLYGARKWALLGVILAYCLQLLKVYVPLYFSEMIEYFSQITPSEIDWDKVWWLLWVIFASYVGQSLFRMIRELIEENKVRNYMSAKIKLFAVDYLAKHSENYFASQKSGQLSQKVINSASETLNTHQTISRLYSEFFIIVTNFYFIGRVSLWFLLLVILFSSLSTFVSYKNSFKLRTLNQTAQDAFDEYNGTVADSIGNALNVKASGSEEFELSYIRKKFNHCKNTRLEALDKLYNGFRFQNTMICLFQISTILLLVKLWYMQEISIGDVTLVLILMNNLILVSSRVLNEISHLNTLFGKLQASMSPFVENHEIVDNPKAKSLKIGKASIEFRNVKFSYGKKKVFNGLNLQIKAGEKIGVVGSSGSGKSTLINILQRAYDIQSGEILIDGQNISQIKQNSLHDVISLIPQDTSLFHRTIAQNIAYGKPNAKPSEIEEAAKKAYADEFIKTLPDGYNTKVGEKGVKLSGGQRQRIAIARAIIRNTPILVLDEATSALDSETEKYIKKAMKNLMKNKTVIAIAHRLSTLKDMDRIIVLDKGKIIEQGKIEDLLNSKGKFQHLWNIQNEE